MDRLVLLSTGRRGDRRDPSHEPKWGYAGPRMARMRLILTDTDGIVDSPKRGDWFVSSMRDSQGDPCPWLRLSRLRAGGGPSACFSGLKISAF